MASGGSRGQADKVAVVPAIDPDDAVKPAVKPLGASRPSARKMIASFMQLQLRQTTCTRAVAAVADFAVVLLLAVQACYHTSRSWH
jgi:hypothetical protein